MESTGRRIFVACATGTMVGLLISTSLPQLIWWLGALAGGLAGASIYSFSRIRRYAGVSARTAWDCLSFVPQSVKTATSLTEKIRQLLQRKKWEAAAVIAFIASASIYIGFFVFYIDSGLDFLALVFIAFPETQLLLRLFPKNQSSDEKQIQNAKFSILCSIPITGIPIFAWYLTRWIALGIIICTPYLRKALKELVVFLAVFAKTLFLYIHSKELVLCTTDATLGVLLAYPVFILLLAMPLGPAMVLGGCIGGLLGVANYEIVSKRILRIIPYGPY